LGEPFEGSAALLTLADELMEIKTVCHCGRKATMNMRVEYLVGERESSRDARMVDSSSTNYRVIRSGNPIDIGGNDKYVSVCMKHFFQGQAHAQI
jgi:thymidine kinase